MYSVNDYLKCGKDVCKVKEIKEKRFNDMDYYLLIPIKDESLKIEIPVTSEKLSSLISIEDLNDLLKNIPNIEPIDMEEKFLENEYKRLLSTGDYEDAIKVIKTTYLRNKKRKENNKKLAEKDINYFQQAEDYLYNEFSVVLGKDYDETKEYIINKIDEIAIS